MSRLKPGIEIRRGNLESRFKDASSSLEDYVMRLRPKLELLFAYTSALELQNEQAARECSSRLYSSRKNDPEYQDTLGFVLMRFAANTKELDEAENLFRAAEDNKDTEEMTKKLVQLHLK